MNLMQRRRELIMCGSDPFANWERDTALLNNGTTRAAVGYMTSPFIDVDPTISTRLSIAYYFETRTAPSVAVPLVEYDENHKFISYTTADNDAWKDRRPTFIKATTRYVRLTCKADRIDDCYTMYSTGVYIFKGKNV